MTHPTLPKDATPNLIKRVGEVESQSLFASKVGVLARAACDDPDVVAITRVADTLSRLNRDRCVESLHMIAMVDRTYPLLLKTLTETETSKRRAVLQEYEAALKKLLPGREIVEDGSVDPLLANPKYGESYFSFGMITVRAGWTQCGTIVEKRLFVEQCLLSDKGYSKTARSIIGWVPPSKASTDVLVERWLEQMSNTNILTGDSLVGEPTTIGDQLRARFLDPSATAPTDEELTLLWISLLKFLSDNKNLELRKEAVRAVISQDATDLIGGLRGFLPNARKHVYDLNASGFDGVYAKLLPDVEDVDPQTMISYNERMAIQLGNWAKSLQYSVPELKKLRFGTGIKSPSTLEQQLNAIKLDPGVTIPKPQQLMELAKLKGEVKKRARARLGGDVDLTTTDPKQLDGALFIAEVAQQFLSEKANLEQANVRRKQEMKKLPAWPPPK
ncbi:MAG TPA: hypothetical protein VIP11_05665 [Gemmatimonadaceae bacterium]